MNKCDKCGKGAVKPFGLAVAFKTVRVCHECYMEWLDTRDVAVADAFKKWIKEKK